MNKANESIAEQDEFEDFTGRNQRSPEEAILSLQVGHKLTLNKKAFEGMGSPEAVIVGFNRARGVLRLTSADPKLPTAYPVKRMSPRILTYSIYCSAALRHFGVVSQRSRFKATVSDGVLTANFEEPISRVLASERPSKKSKSSD